MTETHLNKVQQPAKITDAAGRTLASRVTAKLIQLMLIQSDILTANTAKTPV